MKKKSLLTLGVCTLILANPLSFSYAKSEIVEGRAYKMALQYIENSLSDEAWKDNNPIIAGQKKYYTDKDKKVSYIEYKVSCDSTPDCGFIMMNVDGNDVTVPIASPSGNTPSEILDQGTNIEEKLYYFGPFDLYSENEISGDVQTLDPQLVVDLRDDTQVKRNTEEKKTVKEQKEALKAKLKEAKLAAKEFKKSEQFKKQKEEIKDQILSVPKEEFSMKILDMAEAVTYTNPGVSNIFVPTSSTSSSSTCSGRTPCYAQFTGTYSGTSCKSGCTPTALAIVYGYHDRNNFQNLMYGTAPLTNSTATQTMTNIIRGQMLTTCAGGLGSTTFKNITLAEQYAKDMGYLNSDIVWSGVGKTISEIFTKTKSEINSGRPIIFATSDHAIVGFGYKSSPSTSNVVRSNLGWGGTSSVSSGGINYYNSNIDLNLSGMFYNSTTHAVVEYATVLIKN